MESGEASLGMKIPSSSLGLFGSGASVGLTSCILPAGREGAPVGGLASGPEVINVQIRSIWPGILQSREGRAAGARLSTG